MEQQLGRMTDKVDDLKNRSRRNYVIVYGGKERDNKNIVLLTIMLEILPSATCTLRIKFISKYISICIIIYHQLVMR